MVYYFDMDEIKAVMKKKKMYIDDFARRAGISIKTAKRFLNSPDRAYKAPIKAIRTAYALEVQTFSIIKLIIR